MVATCENVRAFDREREREGERDREKRQRETGRREREKRERGIKWEGEITLNSKHLDKVGRRD